MKKGIQEVENKENWCSRTEILLGAEGVKKLEDATVAIFGIGGVGGFAAEALARSGVGHLELVDHDTVSVSNINRQIVALHSTVGKYKVDVMKDRILDINPEINVVAHKCFYLPQTAGEFDFSKYDYVVDCIDTFTGKLQLVEAAKAAGVPIICSMGAGNKLDPTAFEVADISKTSVCPLAKVMRRELKKRNIKNVKVVYSKEEPVESKVQEEILTKQDEDGNKNSTGKKRAPGSISFVPSVAGLILAGEVIKDLTRNTKDGRKV